MASQYDQNLQAESLGAQKSGGDPREFLGKVAKGFVDRLNGQSPSAQPTNVGDPSLMSYEQNAAAPVDPEKAQHMANLKAAADASAAKYRQENNLDENLEPIQK